MISNLKPFNYMLGLSGIPVAATPFQLDIPSKNTDRSIACFFYIDHDLLVIYEGYEMMKVEKKQRWALRQPCRRPQIPVATAGFEGNRVRHTAEYPVTSALSFKATAQYTSDLCRKVL
jgi:hypothetical protein